MSPVKADPVTEFLTHLLSGICSDRVFVIRDGSQIFVSTSAREFGRVLGQKGKMWGAIKTCAFHAARLAKVDPPMLTLETPDERSEERDKLEFQNDWDREAFMEYLAPILQAIVPGMPDAKWATDDPSGATIRSVWDSDYCDRLANVPAALGIILASAGCRVGARITFEVVWR